MTDTYRYEIRDADLPDRPPLAYAGTYVDAEPPSTPCTPSTAASSTPTAPAAPSSP